MADVMLIVENVDDVEAFKTALAGSGNDDSPILKIERVLRYEMGEGFTDVEVNSTMVDEVRFWL